MPHPLFQKLKAIRNHDDDYVKEMASKLNMDTTELSGIEHGRQPVTEEFLSRFNLVYKDHPLYIDALTVITQELWKQTAPELNKPFVGQANRKPLVKWEDFFGNEHLLIEGQEDDVFHIVPQRRDDEGNSYTEILSKAAIMNLAAAMKGESES